MSFQDILGVLVPLVITLTLSVLVVLGIGLMLQYGRRVRREPLPWIFFFVAIAIVIGPIASGRNLSGLAVVFEADIESFQSWIWATRIVNLIVFLLAVERITRHVLAKPHESMFGWPLYLAFLTYVLTNSVINGIWGSVPELSHLTVYPIVVTLAITIIAPRELPRLIWFAKTAVLCILVLSALTLLVDPSAVLQRGYRDGFLSVRYWGLGSHANTLSPLIVCMLCCLWHQPYQRALVNRLGWTLGVGSLLLTQSKTAIVAYAIVLVILAFCRYRDSLPAVQRFLAMRGLIIGTLGFLMLLTLGALVVQVVFDFGDLFDIARKTRTGGQVVTFSSRELIWHYALQEWRASPWFGYGPTIFNAQYRLLIGLSQAFHAHNQFMQSLSAAGNFGVVGLLIFGSTLTVFAWRAAPASSGLSMALMAFVLMRAVTEVPFALRGVANVEYFFLMVLYAVCVAYQPVAVERRRTAGELRASSAWQSSLSTVR